VVQDVIAGEESARLDLPILRWLAAHRDATLTHVMTVVRDATSIWAALVAAAIGLVLTWRRPARLTRITLAGCAWAGALLLALTVGLTVGRTPPPAMYTVAAAPTGHRSFPAVGVTVTTAVAGLFAAQASVSARSWARAVAAWTAAILWAAAAGAAAAYFGTQWTTDVFGGWTLGAAWDAVLLTGWWTWFRRQANEALAPEDDDITSSAPRPAY
jgi:undecaprenyl-diphosphatase